MLVDDDRTDVLLFERAFKRLQITNPVVHSSNGKEAVEYLLNPSNRKPWLVLTDLNTPAMSGFEFLRRVKSHEALKRTVIVVLSGSSYEKDVGECFRLGAAGYMTKPTDYTALVEMLQTIQTYWTLSRIPPES